MDVNFELVLEFEFPFKLKEGLVYLYTGKTNYFLTEGNVYELNKDCTGQFGFLDDDILKEDRSPDNYQIYYRNYYGFVPNNKAMRILYGL